MDNIVFVGDSFVTNFMHDWNFKFRYDIREFYKEYDYHVVLNGDPSRDVQTIVDIWIKYIPLLTPNDLLVIIVPPFTRTRLPQDTSGREYGKFDGSFHIPNYFIGTKSINPNVKLELWEDNYDINYFCEKLETQELINGSTSAQKNFIEIIESLKKITPCKSLVMSWVPMEIKTENILDKNDLIEKIGYWETYDDVYERTNGEEGSKGDLHWSFDYNKKVFNFIKEYFDLKKNIKII